MSAADLVRAAWDEVPTCYRALRLGAKGLVLLSGGEGAGKSTMLVRMLDSVPGPVVLLSAEMMLGPQLGALLGRLGVKRESFVALGSASVDQLHEVLVRQRVVALGIDSVQASRIESADMRHMLATTPIRLLVGTSQLNKQGSPAGVRALLHEVDVHVEVEAMRWRLVKSRYQPTGIEGPVLGDRQEAA